MELSTFQHFEDLFRYLEKVIIKRYAEFDDEGHCYTNLSDVIPLIVEAGGGYKVNFRDVQYGKLVHVLMKEKDFEKGIVERLKDSQMRIILKYKSGYMNIMVIELQ